MTTLLPPNSPFRRNGLVLTVAVMCYLAIPNFAKQLVDQRERIDFQVFYRAGRAVLLGASPYAPEYDPTRQYIYPQAWAWLMQPLSALPLPSADHAWHLISGAMYIAVVILLTWWSLHEHLPRRPGCPDARSVAAFAVIAGLGYTPIHYGWRLGQLDLLLLFLMTLGMVAPARARPWTMGMAIGAGIVLKISPIMLVPALGLAFGWRFVGGMAAVIAAYATWLLATGRLPEEVMFFGTRMNYWGFFTRYPANSIYKLLCVELFPAHFLRPDGYYNGPFTTLLEVIFSAIYAIAGLRVWWQRGSWLSLLAIGVAFSHFASPYLEPHHYSSTLLVLLPYLVLLLRAGDWGPFVLAMAIWFLGVTYLHYQEVAGGMWPQYVLLVTDPMLLALAMWRPRFPESSATLLRLPLPARWQPPPAGAISAPAAPTR